MRHIIGSSKPDAIIGSDKDQTRGCKNKDKDHMEFCEAQAACGRYFVHELTSVGNSRMQCMAKIMAIRETRTTVADLCMFGLAACDDGGPGFVNASVLTVTNARQVGILMQSKCIGTHRHARVDANRNMGTSSFPSNGGGVERGQGGVDAGAEAESKGCKEDTRDCS